MAAAGNSKTDHDSAVKPESSGCRKLLKYGCGYPLLLLFLCLFILYLVSCLTLNREVDRANRDLTVHWQKVKKPRIVLFGTPKTGNATRFYSVVDATQNQQQEIAELAKSLESGALSAQRITQMLKALDSKSLKSTLKLFQEFRQLHFEWLNPERAFEKDTRSRRERRLNLPRKLKKSVFKPKLKFTAGQLQCLSEASVILDFLDAGVQREQSYWTDFASSVSPKEGNFSARSLTVLQLQLLKIRQERPNAALERCLRAIAYSRDVGRGNSAFQGGTAIGLEHSFLRAMAWPLSADLKKCDYQQCLTKLRQIPDWDPLDNLDLLELQVRFLLFEQAGYQDGPMTAGQNFLIPIAKNEPLRAKLIRRGIFALNLGRELRYLRQSTNFSKRSLYWDRQEREAEIYAIMERFEQSYTVSWVCLQIAFGFSAMRSLKCTRLIIELLIASQIHRCEFGQFPTRLQQLKKHFGGKIPDDPLSNGCWPLILKSTKDRLLIESSASSSTQMSLYRPGSEKSWERLGP